MSKSDTQWFVEPLDYFTNEAIARVLAREGLVDEAEQVGVVDKYGKVHNLWRVPGGKIQLLHRAKKTESRFQFRFWLRNGQNGIINPADFIEKRRSSVKVQTVKRALAARTANRVR
jgi:hypothetical protein